MFTRAELHDYIALLSEASEDTLWTERVRTALLGIIEHLPTDHKADLTQVERERNEWKLKCERAEGSVHNLKRDYRRALDKLTEAEAALAKTKIEVKPRPFVTGLPIKAVQEAVAQLESDLDPAQPRGKCADTLQNIRIALELEPHEGIIAGAKRVFRISKDVENFQNQLSETQAAFAVALTNSRRETLEEAAVECDREAALCETNERVTKNMTERVPISNMHHCAMGVSRVCANRIRKLIK